MKNQLFLLAALFVIETMLPATALAQNYEDVVHLKNGSVIRGVIVEQVPNESLKIETRDGNLFVYQMSEVEKMTKEMQKTTDDRGFFRGQFNKPQGHMRIFEIGGGIGVGEWGTTRVSISMINGYRLMPQFAIGFGFGVEFYPNVHHTSNNNIYYYGGSQLSLPIFLHLRSDFIDSEVSPYVAVNAGYNLQIDSIFKGMMFEPSFGVGFNIGHGNRMTVGVSFIMNQVKYAYGDSSGYNEGTAMGNALKLKVGLSF
ncbi:MAG: hypothetical protein LBM20_06165 [Rikenellaceae bacterium]|jgi:hypothetical protein|nr:hypothetical protein [Rikenellaceae bacterium]